MKNSSAMIACATLVCGGGHGVQYAQAQTQASPIQLYGTFNVDVENVQARGASRASSLAPGQLGAALSGIDVNARNRVTQNSSNIGFRGRENLAGDLEVFFQVESTAAIDSGGSVIASRNTAVGVQGGFGSVRIGQWDTPYKTLSGVVDPMYFTGITYTGAIIGTPGFSVGPVTAGGLATSADGRTYANAINASFERRQGNVLQYWTPTINGFSYRLAYSVNENKSSRAANVTQVDPTVLSMSAQYQLGPISLGYAYEMHRDLFGLSALTPSIQAAPVAALAGAPAITARDRGDKLVARYEFGGTQLGAMWEKLRYEQSVSNASAGAFNKYTRNAMVFTLQHRLGAGTIRGFYAKAQDGSCGRVDGSACDTAGLGASQLSLGYSYSFSRRTDLYWFYTRVANGTRGSYQFANSAGVGGAPGSASIGYVSGIRHTF
jgi:predicted porin